jgi:hypothetical protein
VTSTATDIYNALPISASIKGASASISILYPLNIAIEHSWPTIKFTEYATSVATLDEDTFVYSLAAVTPTIPNPATPGPGIAKVFIVEDSTNEPEVPHRDVEQYFDHSVPAWYLKFGPSLVSAYDGKTVNILYQRPHALITHVSNDTIYLPRDYLIQYCIYWYCEQMALSTNKDRASWEPRADAAWERMEKALKRSFVPSLPVLRMAAPDRMR